MPHVWPQKSNSHWYCIKDKSVKPWGGRERGKIYIYSLYYIYINIKEAPDEEVLKNLNFVAAWANGLPSSLSLLEGSTETYDREVLKGSCYRKKSFIYWA